MNTETLEDKRTLWVMFYAQTAFRHARESCSYILEHKITKNDLLFYPLCTSLVINYARPFASCQGLGQRNFGRKKISLLIPNEYVELHRSLLQNRDQNFAHTDATDDSPNEVRFLIHRGEPGKLLNDIFLNELSLKQIAFKEVSILLNILIEKTEYHIMRIRNKYNSILPLKSGEYVLNIKETPDIFCLPVEPMCGKVDVLPRWE